MDEVELVVAERLDRGQIGSGGGDRSHLAPTAIVADPAPRFCRTVLGVRCATSRGSNPGPRASWLPDRPIRRGTLSSGDSLVRLDVLDASCELARPARRPTHTLEGFQVCGKNGPDD